MTCEKWLANRTRFENEGRSKDALSDIRERIRRDIADAYVKKNLHKVGIGFTDSDLNNEAMAYAKTILTRNHAILHNPDQVAGGELMTTSLYNDGEITNKTKLKASALVGHLGTNSSIGSQWGYNDNERVVGIKNHVNSELQKVSENEKKTIKMNVKWK